MKQTAKISPLLRDPETDPVTSSNANMADSLATELDVTTSYFADYYDAIVADDHGTVGHVLSLCSSEAERNRLMNLPFRFPTVYVAGSDVTNDEWYFEVSYPVLLAAVVGSTGVLDIFVQQGADFLVTDLAGCNVLHVLSAQGYVFPEKEDHLVRTYHFLLERLPTDLMRRLLLSECKLRTRPLETAGVFACYQLSMAMWETRGIYLSKIQTINATTYKWYDVTDYEQMDSVMKKRGRLSPLLIFQYIPKEKLGDRYARKLTQPCEGLYSEWLACRRRSYCLPLIMWGIIRVSVIMLFLVYETDIRWVKQVGGIPQSEYDRLISGNGSGNISDNAFPICDQFVLTDIPETGLLLIRFVLSGIAVFSFLKEVFDILTIVVVFQQQDLPTCHTRKLKRTLPLVSKPSALQYPIYAVADILSPFLIATIVNVLPIMTSRVGTNATVLEVMRIITSLTLMYTAFYLMQLLPFVGPFIITCNSLLVDLTRFLLVLTIILLVGTVYMTIMMNQKSDQGCIEGFSSFPRSVYTTFFLSIHILDLSKYHLVSVGTLFFFHAALVVFIGVLLMNFLIGLLSRSIAEMSEHMPVICAVQYINVTMMLEYRAFYFLKPYFRWAQPRYYSVAGGRVYVVVKAHPRDTDQHLQNWQAEGCPIGRPTAEEH